MQAARESMTPYILKFIYRAKAGSEIQKKYGLRPGKIYHIEIFRGINHLSVKIKSMAYLESFTNVAQAI